MKKIFQSSLKRRILFTVIGLVIWCSIAIPITFSFIDYGRVDKLKESDIFLSKANTYDNIIMDFRVLYTDLAKRAMRVYIGIYPNGTYANEDDGTWTKTVELQFLHKNAVAKKGSYIDPINFDIPLQTGTLRDYPFDKYSSNVWFSAMDNSTKEYIPLTIFTTLDNQNIETNFVRNMEDFKDVDINLQGYNIYIFRTKIVYFFCFFISTVTWGLTIVALNIGIDCVFFKRDIPVNLLSIGITMLFAMPALRKTQPDIPDVGCALDFLCFIWCEILIGIASIMMLYSWLLRWRLPIE